MAMENEKFVFRLESNIQYLQFRIVGTIVPDCYVFIAYNDDERLFSKYDGTAFAMMTKDQDQRTQISSSVAEFFVKKKTEDLNKREQEIMYSRLFSGVATEYVSGARKAWSIVYYL